MKTLGLLTVEVKGLLSVLLQRCSLTDAGVLFVGLFMLTLSLFANALEVKIISFVLFIIALSYLYLSLRAKQIGERIGSNSITDDNKTEGQPMSKKIVFDDLRTSPTVHFEEGEDAGERRASRQSDLRPSSISVKREVSDFDIADFFDLNTESFKSESEPRAEFDFLLSKVLSVAKEVLFAHSVVLFWANRDKHQMVLEAKATDSECFMSGRRFAIQTDVVSQIALSGKPQIVTQVNPISEKDLFPYYNQVDFVKSFIGAPVYFDQNVVAVLAADSRMEDAYGAETLALMGQFTKLISALLQTYTGKYDLLVDSEILRAVKQMEDAFYQDFKLKNVLESLMTESSRLVNWDFLTLVLYDEEQRGWVVRNVMKRTEEPYLKGNETIEFGTSLVGSSIKGNTVRSIADMTTVSEPRYFEGENISLHGSFLVLPISSARKCYGALAVESQHVGNYSARDIEILQHLVNLVARATEILYLQEVVKEYVIVDEVTGTCTKKQLLQRIGAEIQHADDFGADLSLVLYSIDSKEDLMERYGNDGFNFVLYSVGRIVQKSIRSYDTLGRFDGHCFGALLLNTAANDAYLWAEKVRKTIASNVLTFQGKSFSVTVSVGVCGAVEGTSRDELVANAVHVLNKATESGSNLVRVF